MTYLTNLIDAILGKPPKLVEVTKYKWKEVVKKDPNGLIKHDMDTIKRIANTRPYKVGDPLDLIAYKAGQNDLIQGIYRHIIAAKTTQL